MSKASRNARRVAAALKPTITERFDTYGLNIDDTKTLNVELARCVTSTLVESSAVHSRSLGWIPALCVTITHVPASGPGPSETVQLLFTGQEMMLDFVQTLNVGMDAAILDAVAGWKLR